VHILSFCDWLDKTQLSAAIRHSHWLFQALDAIHTLGIVFVAGTIIIVDLRLLGFALRDLRVSDITSRIAPLSRWGFVVMLLSGFFLFSSEAVKMYYNPAFRIKLLVLGLVGANAALFHRIIYRNVPRWDDAPSAPIGARFAGLLSLVFWIAVIAAGRAIAYMPGYDS
jgi:hypothetical protein